MVPYDNFSGEPMHSLKSPGEDGSSIAMTIGRKISV